MQLVSDTTKENTVSVKPLNWLNIWKFIKLRNNIDRESSHLVTSGKNGFGNSIRLLVRMFINKKWIKTIVVKEGKDLVGYVSLVFAKFKRLQGNVYLTISIKSSHQNKGLGTKLMLEAEEFLKRHKVRRIELEVFSKNKAVELYKRLGYEIEGKRRKAVENGDGFDDIVFMAKFLK